MQQHQQSVSTQWHFSGAGCLRMWRHPLFASISAVTLRDVGRSELGRVDKAAARSFDDLLTRSQATRERSARRARRTHTAWSSAVAVSSAPAMRASAKCFALWFLSAVLGRTGGRLARGMSVPLARRMPLKCLAPRQKKGRSFRSLRFGSRLLDRRRQPMLLLASACRVG
jgi:hypothetical protein